MLYLKRKEFDAILSYALQGYPNEVCGLIAGTVSGEEKHIGKVYLLTNTDASNEHFSMDPNEQLAAIKDIRANKMVLLGNFHSHPETPSRPSDEDKRLAYDTKSNYLILSLMDQKEPILKAFLINENKDVTEESIEVIQ